MPMFDETDLFTTGGERIQSSASCAQCLRSTGCGHEEGCLFYDGNRIIASAIVETLIPPRAIDMKHLSDEQYDMVLEEMGQFLEKSLRLVELFEELTESVEKLAKWWEQT